MSELRMKDILFFSAFFFIFLLAMDLHHLFSVFFPHSPSLFLCVVTLRNWKTVITHRGLEFHVLFRAASAFAGHVHPSSSMSLGPVFSLFFFCYSFMRNGE